ncbi:hypothetical protein GQ53DRAFT_831516 [Thozetella sp. PMI_491]|nr:hypothetical protein GQ53DRAFT_831516 [Thozetella sp. PMI_491]
MFTSDNGSRPELPSPIFPRTKSNKMFNTLSADNIFELFLIDLFAALSIDAASEYCRPKHTNSFHLDVWSKEGDSTSTTSGPADNHIAAGVVEPLELERTNSGVVGNVENKYDAQGVNVEDGLAIYVRRAEVEAGDEDTVVILLACQRSSFQDGITV